MIARLLLAGLALALNGAEVASVATVRSPAPTPVAPATFVDWNPASVGSVIAADDLVVTNTTGRCPAAIKDQDLNCFVPAAAIVGPRATTRIVSGTSGAHARFGVGPLQRGHGAGAILMTYTGGAHCCERYDVALPGRGGWRHLVVARTEVTDQGPKRQTQFDYGLRSFPTDLDGDGTADFVLGDDAFAYAFASYAGSMSPPVILTIVGDRFVDVSTKPAFRPLFEANLALARRGCTATDEADRNGACAAYAADAARLGRFEAAWPEVLAHYDHSQDGAGAFPRCTALYVAGKCPPGHAISYPDFPTALRDFLRRDGYLPA